jgi:hypothetical protein
MQQQQPLAREEPLWAVKKGDRLLRRIVVYLPTGADLRLLEAGEFRRTVLFRNGDELIGVRRSTEPLGAAAVVECNGTCTTCS